MVPYFCSLYNSSYQEDPDNISLKSWRQDEKNKKAGHHCIGWIGNIKIELPNEENQHCRRFWDQHKHLHILFKLYNLKLKRYMYKVYLILF